MTVRRGRRTQRTSVPRRRRRKEKQTAPRGNGVAPLWTCPAGNEKRPQEATSFPDGTEKLSGRVGRSQGLSPASLLRAALPAAAAQKRAMVPASLLWARRSRDFSAYEMSVPPLDGTALREVPLTDENSSPGARNGLLWASSILRKAPFSKRARDGCTRSVCRKPPVCSVDTGESISSPEAEARMRLRRPETQGKKTAIPPQRSHSLFTTF